MTRHVIVTAGMLLLIAACHSNPHHSDAQSTDSTTLSLPVATNPEATSSYKITITAREATDDSIFDDGSIPVKWKNAGITNSRNFKLFLKQMQLWIMYNDKAQLASTVRYPLKDIGTAAELISRYDSVFTKDVKLSFATINFSQVFRNDKGAMIGDGKVWFAQEGNDFRIIAINP